MTVTIKQAFLRPIEHIPHASGIDFSIADADYVIPSGTYANAITLARALVDAEGADQYLFALRMSETSLGFIEIEANVTSTLIWVNLDLRNALGFSSNVSLTAYGWSTANSLSPYIWLPRFNFADQEAFEDDLSIQFNGALSCTGEIAGMSTGSTYKGRTVSYNFEYATNLGREFATSDLMASGCLDEFVKGALTSAPIVASHPKTKGFWYYQDINEMISDCTLTGNQWGDSGGMEWSNGDTYCFCNFLPEKAKSSWMKNPSLSHSRLLYNADLSFVTAQAATYL